MGNKRKTIHRFFLLTCLGLLLAFALVFLLSQSFGDVFVRWFQNHLMGIYPYQAVYTTDEQTVYVWQPIWKYVRNYALLLLAVAVLVGAVLVLILAHFLTKADVKDRMQGLGEMIQDYMFSDKNAEDVFPKEYNGIAVQMSTIKERMQRHEKLLQEETSRKNDLIAYLAHDLKTPLTSVIGYLSLLSEAPDMPLEQRAKYTNIGFEKAQQLEVLINEFFDITRFNIQEVQLFIAPLDLTTMLVQMTEEFYPLAQAHGNTIHLNASEELVMNGDANKLARVLNNILKNAVAYSDPDTPIIITARQGTSKVSLTIENTGPTIPPEKLSLLFEKFFRLDEARSSQTGGAGLGLAIAKEIVTLHQGTIRAESAHRKTTFIITLPNDLPLTEPHTIA